MDRGVTTRRRRLAMRVDRRCKRLYAGMAVVAVVLAGIVLSIGLDHASQSLDADAPRTAADMAADTVAAAGA